MKIIQDRRHFLAGAAAAGAVGFTNWQFLNEIKRELKT
ncbi:MULTISPECIES: twin-arginine translocation signal domain-containing protein [unclassified Mesorhizobium]|nr:MULTISPECIES: twin-arginine translocation signal domain-containing protein [unclassified Mesorhizobium]